MARTRSLCLLKRTISLGIAIVEWEKAHEPVAARGDWTPARCLRGAAERDERRMPMSGVVADSEIERDSGLTADESLRRGAWRASWPPRAGFEAWRPAGRAGPRAHRFSRC